MSTFGMPVVLLLYPSHPSMRATDVELFMASGNVYIDLLQISVHCHSVPVQYSQHYIGRY